MLFMRHFDQKYDVTILSTGLKYNFYIYRPTSLGTHISIIVYYILSTVEKQLASDLSIIILPAAYSACIA